MWVNNYSQIKQLRHLTDFHGRSVFNVDLEQIFTTNIPPKSAYLSLLKIEIKLSNVSSVKAPNNPVRKS